MKDKDHSNLAAPKVSVVIPAFNEAATIAGVVSDIKALYPGTEVLVIDDGSMDDTAETALEAGAIVYRHAYNIGNGAAVKTGIRTAAGEVLVFMDGDGQHDPKDIQRLLNHIPEYDLVVGARPKGGQTSSSRAFGNWLYNRFASYVAKFPVLDLTSGFRAIKAEVAREFIYLLPNTYSYPTTITLGVLRSGRSVKYQPINIRCRQGGNSNIRVIADGVRFFIIITKICTLFSPFRIFLPVSALMMFLGFFRYIYTFIIDGRFTNMSALLMSTSVIIFMLSLISEQICQLRYERRTLRRSAERVDMAAASHTQAGSAEKGNIASEHPWAKGHKAT